MAQRQRELYSFQHRQRQLLQQKAMLMRQGMTPGPIGGPKGPQQPPQQQPPPQFAYPAGYSPGPGNPPSSPGNFNPMGGVPTDPKMGSRGPVVSQGMMGGMQGQFGGVVNPAVQPAPFQQFAGAGESALLLPVIFLCTISNNIITFNCQEQNDLMSTQKKIKMFSFTVISVLSHRSPTYF